MQRQRESVAQIARIEQRLPNQIAGMALKLFVELPPEVRTALWQIEALGSASEFEEVMKEIARTLLNAQYKPAFLTNFASIIAQSLTQPRIDSDQNEAKKTTLC